MKDYCLELAARQSGLNAKRNIMREYLQAYALRVMQDQGVFRTTAFLGGTALRFLHNLPRFSEDLDFSIIDQAKPATPFVELMAKLKQEFALAGYAVSVTYHDEKTVQSAFVKFDDLLFEAGLVAHSDQKFSIKIEIDTKPPAGAEYQTDIVNKYFPVSFLSHDISSLFAGKMNALLSRKYTKGRDFFDLGWYLSRFKGLAPNMTLLSNGLKQAGWSGTVVREDNWRHCLREVVQRAEWGKVRQDVENFLENPGDAEVFSKENVLRLLEDR